MAKNWIAAKLICIWITIISEMGPIIYYNTHYQNLGPSQYKDVVLPV